MHYYRLRDLDIEAIERETFLSSLETARQALERLGMDATRGGARRGLFREHDETLLEAQYAVRQDEAQLIQTAAQAAAQLQELFEADAKESGEALPRAGTAIENLTRCRWRDRGAVDAVARKRLRDEAGRLHLLDEFAQIPRARGAARGGVPIAWLITMNRPSSSRNPGRRTASASSCCLTPAAASSFCAMNMSVTAGDVGARTIVACFSSRERNRS